VKLLHFLVLVRIDVGGRVVVVLFRHALQLLLLQHLKTEHTPPVSH
jgi:hypothetical protein